MIIIDWNFLRSKKWRSLSLTFFVTYLLTTYTQYSLPVLITPFHPFQIEARDYDSLQQDQGLRTAHITKILTSFIFFSNRTMRFSLGPILSNLNHSKVSSSDPRRDILETTYFQRVNTSFNPFTSLLPHCVPIEKNPKYLLSF